MTAKTETPEFYWSKCYELGDATHWALCDTQTDADSPPKRVTCLEMILLSTYDTDLPEKTIPKLIAKLLTDHYAKRDEITQANEQARLGWERHAEKDAAYQKALNERDQWREVAGRLAKLMQPAIVSPYYRDEKQSALAAYDALAKLSDGGKG